jgi:hypothetical protein
MSHDVPGHFEVRQEEDVLPSPALARVAVAAIGVALLSVFFSALLLETNTGGIRSNENGGKSPPPGGEEIAHIHQTPIWGAAHGLDLRERERDELSHYRWVDRDAGVAAIPIERAMDLVEQRAR